MGGEPMVPAMPDDIPDEDGGYEPDLVEAGTEPSFPQPRSAQVRRGVLQTRPKVKTPKRVNKGAGRILAKEKQRQALELRKGGASYSQIAHHVGYGDQSAARKAVLKAFADIIQEPALEVRTLQVERLNHMLMVLWQKVQQGDERAIDTSLRVMDKMDRLMGTEAAQSVDVNVHQTGAILVIDGSKDDFIRAAKQMAGLGVDGGNRPALEGTTSPPSGAYDVIEGTVIAPIDIGTEDVPLPYVQDVGTQAPVKKKTFEFGVEPTVQ